MNDALTMEMDRLIEEGGEAGIRQLLIDRFAEFDDDEQTEIFMGLFAEALQDLAVDSALEPLQRKGLEMAAQLKAIRDVVLTDEKKKKAGSSETAL